MRPLLLTPVAGGVDGLSKLAAETARALAAFAPASGVHLWALTGRDTNALPSVEVSQAFGSRVRYVGWAVREAMRAQRQRLVVCLHTHLAPLSLPLIWRGARAVHVLVGIESWKRLTPAQAAALSRAELLVSISRHSADEFRKWNPSFGGREIAVCHPGIESNPRELGPPRDDGYALIVGRMASSERYKGHDLLLESWGELRRLQPQAKLVIAGDGDDRGRLESKARQLGLGDAVRFLGRVNDSELLDLYASCSFFVMPSRNEGFGFVFLEAMRTGKPCIGAPGAASEIIEHGATGYVLDPADPDAHVRMMDLLLRDPGRRRQMGTRGRERFLANFTTEHFRNRFRDALGGVGEAQSDAVALKCAPRPPW